MHVSFPLAHWIMGQAPARKTTSEQARDFSSTSQRSWTIRFPTSTISENSGPSFIIHSCKPGLFFATTMRARCFRTQGSAIDYTKRLLAERRAHPQADFFGTLINASAEEASFTDEEIIANAMLLLLAGHVAVRNLIGNALYLLLTHPDELAKLQANPAPLHNVIEETLRYEPPVT